MTDTHYNFESIILKEARHRRLYIVGLHLYEMSKIDKFTETENRVVVAKGNYSSTVCLKD